MDIIINPPREIFVTKGEFLYFTFFELACFWCNWKLAWYLASDFGITGFQAGCVMWDFIRDWQYSDNECGIKIVNYDDMLYPQYDYKFDKVISKDTFEALQKKAWNLYNDRNAHPAVEKHWESIIHGEVPFGYKVKDE